MKKPNIQSIKDYIKWRLKAVNEHGLHSPFMYKLATECFYDKTKYSEYKELQSYIKSLKKNKKYIEVSNLGAGSKHFDSNKRKISDISSIAGSNLKEMKLLYRLSRYFKPENILELGTSLGKSAYALHLGNPIGNITSVEGDKALYETAKKQLANTTIDLVNKDFENYISELPSNQKFDFIYLDGNHTKQASLNYFELLLPHLHNNSLFLLDDIYWSEGMKEAWKILKNHSQVKQSIDAFHKGFLFFRQEQFPEHFYIRLS